MNTIIAVDICLLPESSKIFRCESHVIIYEFLWPGDASNNGSYAAPDAPTICPWADEVIRGM